MNAELRAEQAAGRLSQVCSVCGVVEAAGSYCSSCLTKTGPAAWCKNPGRAAAVAARAAKRASGTSGHPRGDRGPASRQPPTSLGSSGSLTLGLDAR
jgi:hypothetical protein